MCVGVRLGVRLGEEARECGRESGVTAVVKVVGCVPGVVGVDGGVREGVGEEEAGPSSSFSIANAIWKTSKCVSASVSGIGYWCGCVRVHVCVSQANYKHNTSSRTPPSLTRMRTHMPALVTEAHRWTISSFALSNVSAHSARKEVSEDAHVCVCARTCAGVRRS